MNQGRRILNCHLIAFWALLLISCKEENTPGATPKEIPKDTLFAFGIGEKEVWAELAAKPNEREKGLMNRDSLPDGKGMLFVFEKPGPSKVLDEEYENPFGHRIFFLKRQVIGNPCRQALRSERRTLSFEKSSIRFGTQLEWISDHGNKNR